MTNPHFRELTLPVPDYGGDLEVTGFLQEIPTIIWRKSFFTKVRSYPSSSGTLPRHPPPVPGAEARRNLFYQELRVGDREVVPECQRGGFLVLILLAVISVLSCWLPRRSA